MSTFEIGREIERLHQRILMLEELIDNDYNCECNNEDENKDFDIEKIPNSIKVQSIQVSKYHCMKIIAVKQYTDIEKSIILKEDYYTTIKAGIRFVIIFHPLNTSFDFSTLFDSTFRKGLGSGRCSCWKWSGLKCKKTRHDEDCCDKEAYFNRCDDHCDETCSDWDANWWETPDEC